MKILYYCGWFVTRCISKVIFRIRVYGQDHVPKSGGFILAPNHRSYYDPPLAGSWAPREVFFMAKKELFDIPVFGSVIYRTNARPVKRGVLDRQAMDMAIDVIKQGYGITIFPEGTRSRTAQFLPPKPGIGMIAHQARCPIVPVYIHSSDRLKECFLGRRRMSITYGEPISAEWIGSLPSQKESYHTVAQEVIRRIGELQRERLASAQ